MKLPKELTDSILAGVLDKVMDEITPGDDTPDDDDGLPGVVKRGLSPDQDKDSGVMGLMMNALSGSGGGGIMDILGDLLGGGGQQQEGPQQQSSGGGLADILGGLFGGGQQQEEPQQQSSGGGLMDILGSLLGGGQSQRAAAAKDSGLLGTITDAIGGEGVIGDLLESVLRSKNISASNVAENPTLMSKVKDIVVELIKDFVIGKVKASLMGDSSRGGGLNLNKILDMLTPDN